MAELMRAHREWASRPADERFTSLVDLNQHMQSIRDKSGSVRLDLRTITLEATDDDDLVMNDGKEHRAGFTNYSFKQLAAKIGAPPQYLSELPSHIVADAMNHGVKALDDKTAKASMLMTSCNNGLSTKAILGPDYTRIWNSQVTAELVNRFGDGVNGDWKVPGEFGKDVPVTMANTTLYGSDRDMFVFLADEKHKVSIPNRRNGEAGSLSRGFFVWNSEVGAATLGVAWFLFDYVCGNRIVWGAQDYKEITMRHTKTAQERYFDDFLPVLNGYANQSAMRLEDQLVRAQGMKIASDKVIDFLEARSFNTKQARLIAKAHEAEEMRPIETVWDAVTGVTAYAKSINNTNERVVVERIGGKILELAAN